MPAREPIALNREAFARNFNRLFVPLGMSARAFALEIGVGEDKVSKWRKAALPVPELPTLFKMAVMFRVSLEALLVGVHPTYNKMVEAGKTVQKETVQKSTPVAHSTVPALAGTEGRNAPLVASAIDFRHLVGLSLPERVHAATIISMQLAALLRGRPEAASADAHQPRRSAGHK